MFLLLSFFCCLCSLNKTVPSTQWTWSPMFLLITAGRRGPRHCVPPSPSLAPSFPPSACSVESKQHREKVSRNNGHSIWHLQQNIKSIAFSKDGTFPALYLVANQTIGCIPPPHRVSVQELKKHSLVALERPTFGIIAENTFNDSGVTY